MSDPARRVFVLASTAAACAALLGACGASGPSRPQASEAGQAVEAGQEFDVTVTTDKSAYAVGETVLGRITVVNRSDATVRLRFSSSQRFDFLVRSAAGEDVWRWSAFRFFAQVLGEEELAPGGVLSYQDLLAGDFGPGRYSVVGSVVVRDAPLRASAAFTVR